MANKNFQTMTLIQATSHPKVNIMEKESIVGPMDPNIRESLLGE